MTILKCRYCGRQSTVVMHGDMLIVSPCVGCGATDHELHELAPRRAPRQRQWFSSGSMTLEPLPVFEMGHHEPLGYLNRPEPAEFEYTIR